MAAELPMSQTLSTRTTPVETLEKVVDHDGGAFAAEVTGAGGASAEFEDDGEDDGVIGAAVAGEAVVSWADGVADDVDPPESRETRHPAPTKASTTAVTIKAMFRNARWFM